MKQENLFTGLEFIGVLLEHYLKTAKTAEQKGLKRCVRRFSLCAALARANYELCSALYRVHFKNPSVRKDLPRS